MKTIFITGASAGIGKSTAQIFANLGWQVVATMRSPEKETELTKNGNILVLPLDVTKPETIDSAVKTAVDRFGSIDVLVNNAGFYTIGALESFSDEDIVRQIDTNLVGLIRVTKAVLPYMRQRRSGKIVNLSSIAGRMTVPIQSLYHATKWGVEGFTEALQFELKPFGIDVALVEPGVINTDFYGRSMNCVLPDNEYKGYVTAVRDFLVKSGGKGSKPEIIGETIYKIAESRKPKLRYIIGKSTFIVPMHKILPRSLYMYIVNKIMAR